MSIKSAKYIRLATSKAFWKGIPGYAAGLHLAQALTGLRYPQFASATTRRAWLRTLHRFGDHRADFWLA